MRISVRTSGGARFEIEANPSDTIADLKTRIETRLGSDAFPAAHQVLVHGQGEEVLRDNTTLEDNNITEDTSILLSMTTPATPPCGGDGGGSAPAVAAQPMGPGVPSSGYSCDGVSQE